MDMEGVKMEYHLPKNIDGTDGSLGDLCNVILSQFGKSNNQHHVHICTAIVALSQELKHQNLPLTPITYFGATCSSLQGLLYTADSEGTASHIIDALCTILSFDIPRINNQLAILKMKHEYLSGLMIRLLGLKNIGVEGIVSCFKCVMHLLFVGNCWSDVAQLYGVFVGYITDDRQRVRKMLHTCLRDVLQNFQLSPVLAPLSAPASETITNLFEKYLLLAGGATVNASERPKGAQGVLHMLDALKICLPFISSKYLNSSLKYFKSLLELQQPLVNRHITDALVALCIHPTAEVSPEVLLDILGSLATSVSAKESSVDTMTVAARLLGVGMRRVYSIDRQLCVVKLPVVVNSLRDVLVSEHEEAIRAALEALKSLIHECIDENLIKQGVDNVISSNTDTSKSGPTIIEKICAIIESLLTYHYSAIWDISFQVVIAMFDKLGYIINVFQRGMLALSLTTHT
ncbi:hypothetical protein P3S67_001578 [Capsicum chacoense]